MDEKLKARLIGAAILVAVAVLLIPELLSGPKATQPPEATGGDGKRVFTIELDAKQASRADAVPPVTEDKPAMPQLPAPEVAPKAGAARQATEGGKPLVRDSVVADIAPSDETIAGPPPATAVKTAPDQAAATAQSAASTGTSGSTTKPPPEAADGAPSPEPKRTSGTGSGGWSVQVGAFGTSAAASKLVSKLRSDGFNAYTVPPTRGAKPLYRVRVGPEPSQAAADRLAARLKSRGLPAAVVEK